MVRERRRRGREEGKEGHCCYTPSLCLSTSKCKALFGSLSSTSLASPVSCACTLRRQRPLTFSRSAGRGRKTSLAFQPQRRPTRAHSQSTAPFLRVLVDLARSSRGVARKTFQLGKPFLLLPIPLRRVDSLSSKVFKGNKSKCAKIGQLYWLCQNGALVEDRPFSSRSFPPRPCRPVLFQAIQLPSAVAMCLCPALEYPGDPKERLFGHSAAVDAQVERSFDGSADVPPSPASSYTATVLPPAAR